MENEIGFVGKTLHIFAEPKEGFAQPLSFADVEDAFRDIAEVVVQPFYVGEHL